MRDPVAIVHRNLADSAVRMALPKKAQPYYFALSYGRHIGYQYDAKGKFWVARYRAKASKYRRRRLGTVAEEGQTGLTYDEAVQKAWEWFSTAQIPSSAPFAKPLSATRHLHVCALGEEPTVGHALEEWVAWKRIAAAMSHFGAALSLINHHIVPRLASVRLSEFNGTTLREFINDVLETAPKRGNQRLGPRRSLSTIDEESLRKRKKTVNTLISILRLSFRLAWENGIVETDKPLRCLRKLPNIDRPRTIHLSRGEARRLLECCRDDVRRLVLGALYTGCRATELVRMLCRDVGRDGYGVYVAPAKTHRPRFVFLPDEAMAWFLDLIKGRQPHEHVFQRYDGSPWFDRSYRYSFATAVHEAGLPEGFVFHSLRHTYASQLIQSGTTIFAVAEQLGHADPATVLRTYGHLSPQIRESEVRQRFTVLDDANHASARRRKAELTNWRSNLYGGEWESYAEINSPHRHPR